MPTNEKEKIEPPPPHPIPVLVADDEETTRIMLEEFLWEWGYAPMCVPDGLTAFNALHKPDAPCLAIIDWMMPGMDGTDLIQAVRSAKFDRYIYVIMLTARQEQEALLKGLEAGADDFVPKPFDARELQSRIAVGARVVKMQNQLKAYAQNLETLAEERAAQLIHADRLSSLGIMAAGVAHEINNPCTSISSNMQLLKRMWKTLSPILQQNAATLENNGLSSAQLAFFQTEMPGMIENSLNSVKRITQIVRSLKTYSHKEGAGFQQCSLNQCIHEALRLCAGPLKQRLAITEKLAENLPPFYGDAQQMEQVLVNLIMNAADALQGRTDANLTITTTWIDTEHIEARIQDNGPGIPEDAFSKLFMPFFTTKSMSKGTGLGLSICESIMNSFGGRISASNSPQGGACFTLYLPIS